jgi:hypothetical protein
MRVGGIFCDLTKAFDCVTHELVGLLSKLNFYGTLNIAGQCFKSCLHDRKQQVDINIPDSNNSIYSYWGVMKHGVPQGSVLGLCFFSYIISAPNINTQSKQIHILC